MQQSPTLGPLRVCAASFLLLAACTPRPIAPAPAPVPAAESSPPCPLSPRDQAFVAEFHRLWATAVKTDLTAELGPLPTTIVATGACAYYVNGEVDGAVEVESALQWRGEPVRVTSLQHDGEVIAPDGRRFPAKPAAFAVSAGGQPPFFYLAGMELWMSHPRASKVDNAAEFVLSVALHEMMHTRQLPDMARIIQRRLGDESPARLSEVVLEAAFADDENYQRAMRAEIDALWTAYTDSDQRVAKIREAIALKDARHRTYFVGDREYFAKVEGVFWNSEGVAEWLRYRALSSPERLADNTELAALEPTFHNYESLKATTRAQIVAQIREHTRREHAQEAGLALMLLVAELVPTWRDEVLSPEMADLYELLRDAVGGC